MSSQSTLFLEIRGIWGAWSDMCTLKVCGFDLMASSGSLTYSFITMLDNYFAIFDNEF